MTALPRILIVGGYGVVGRQIAGLITARNPGVELWIGGRSAQAAGVCAASFTGARAIVIDVDSLDPLAGIAELPNVIVAVANDRNDNLLLASARRGIAYIDITRWTPRLLMAMERLSAVPLTAPVIFASGWMAGVAASVAAHYSAGFGDISSIEIDILYGIKDRAGPNSVEYADQLDKPFTIWSGGQQIIVKPMTDPHAVAFSDGQERDCYRFDTPDQYTLVQTLGAAGVSSRLTYDDPAAVRFMRLLLASGLWRLLSLPLFKRLRRGILYNPGEGATHEIAVQITGAATDGGRQVARMAIIDPLGQTHMTAAGAVAQIERVLGLGGRAVPPQGICFPEQAVDHEKGLAALREMGLAIERGP